MGALSHLGVPPDGVDIHLVGLLLLQDHLVGWAIDLQEPTSWWAPPFFYAKLEDKIAPTLVFFLKYKKYRQENLTQRTLLYHRFFNGNVTT